jgi:hypothetical protein
MTYQTAFLLIYLKKDLRDMVNNIYKFEDGKTYTIADETYSGQCQDCAFRNKSKNCMESSKYVNCLVSSIIWQPINEEPMKSITQEIKEFDVNQINIDEQIPGTKYDGDKLQYSLIPPNALMEIARNLTIGLKKYKERDNWKKVPNANQRYLDALYRHLEAHRRGEIYDPDSSVPDMPHLAAVAVNAMFLLEFMLDENLKEVKE